MDEDERRDRDGVWFAMLCIGLPILLIVIAIWGGPALRWIVHQL